MCKIVLEGKTVVITGASSGLGRRLALDLAKRNVKLVLASRNLEALNEVAVELGLDSSSLCVQRTDVRDAEQCEKLIKKTIQTFHKIDFLILNAGISMWVRFDEITNMSIFKTLMETNYMGAVNCIYPAFTYLRQNKGTIVAVSSAQAVMGMPNHTAYTASKHALRGFLESLEMEIGDSVRILNVMPGWIRDTNVRANALRGDGNPTGLARKHNRYAVSLESCSAQILRAMESGAREVYIPSSLRFLPWLKLVVPGWVRAGIKRVTNQQDG